MQISTRLALSLHPGLDVTRLDSLVTLVSRVLLVSLVLCDLGGELALPISFIVLVNLLSSFGSFTGEAENSL